MTGDPVEPESASARAEDAVRLRWRERDVEPRIVAPDDASAAAYVIHGGPPSVIASADDGAIALHATIDVVARHRAMCGASVVRVVGQDRAPHDGDGPVLGARLGCLPYREVYRTTDATYVDSVWWAVVQLWEAGLLRQVWHLAQWCPRCAAPVDDRPALHVERSSTPACVRFPITGDNALRVTGASLLVDVPDPWMLPSVTAVRLDPAAGYVLAQAPGDDYPLVLARSAVVPLLGAGTTIHRDVAVDELRDVTYRPVGGGGDEAAGRDVVIEVAGTSAVARTGLAPVAPGCGSGDVALAEQHDLVIVDPFGSDGRLAAVDGLDVRDDITRFEQALIATLRARGLVVSAGERTQGARGCRACGGVVVHRARPTWSVARHRLPEPSPRDVDPAQRSTDDPRGDVAPDDGPWPVASHGADGIPLPLWRCTRCRHVTAVDSGAALMRLAGRDVAGEDGHAARPDGVVVRCQGCGDDAARWVGQVVDPLVAAAAAPFARFGFPASPGSDTDVAHHAHADLLVDGSLRTGRWADAVQTLSVLVWNAEGVDVTLPIGPPTHLPGAVPAAMPDAGRHIGRHGADAVRWAVLVPTARGNGGGPPAATGMLRRLLDACDEHTATAGVDGWRPFDVATPTDVDGRSPMDRWVLAELSDTVAVVRQRLDALDLRGAGRRIHTFVDDLADWYLPRTRPSRGSGEASRSRRASTHATLHECLVTVAALLAPFVPFTSDELYERLVRGPDPAAPDSVHLLRYPTVDPTARNDGLREAMTTARRLAAAGDRGRRQAGIDPQHTVERAVVTAPSHLRPYWSVLRPLLTDALRVARIDLTADGTPAEIGRQGRWRVTRDHDTAVALELPATTRHRSTSAAPLLAEVAAP